MGCISKILYCSINFTDRKQTFLDVLIQQSGGEKGFSNLELREEVMTFLVAAMDTSAVTMGFTLKLLAKFPDVQQKVFDEYEAFRLWFKLSYAAHITFYMGI